MADLVGAPSFGRLGWCLLRYRVLSLFHTVSLTHLLPVGDVHHYFIALNEVCQSSAPMLFCRPSLDMAEDLHDTYKVNSAMQSSSVLGSEKSLM